MQPRRQYKMPFKQHVLICEKSKGDFFFGHLCKIKYRIDTLKDASNRATAASKGYPVTRRVSPMRFVQNKSSQRAYKPDFVSAGADGNHFSWRPTQRLCRLPGIGRATLGSRPASSCSVWGLSCAHRCLCAGGLLPSPFTPVQHVCIRIAPRAWTVYFL